jgi:hypothetical protein
MTALSEREPAAVILSAGLADARPESKDLSNRTYGIYPHYFSSTSSYHKRSARLPL